MWSRGGTWVRGSSEYSATAGSQRDQVAIVQRCDRAPADGDGVVALAVAARSPDMLRTLLLTRT